VTLSIRRHGATIGDSCTAIIVRALPSSAFAPFTGADALQLSDIPACSAWPTSGARELARAIPGSHLLVVPFTGHSVLGADRAGLAKISQGVVTLNGYSLIGGLTLSCTIAPKP
jgi:hypothetical protein